MVVPGLLALALGVVDAPVTNVTVFSDRARVTRTASVSLSATQKLELPLLLDTIDPATVRLDASGAEVRRVEIAHVDAQAFPKTEAHKLLDQLDALGDTMRATDAERGSCQAVLDVLDRVRPTLPPADPLKPQPKLVPGNWGSAMTFTSTYREKLQARARAASDKLVDLERERQKLLQDAAKLDATRHGGYRVTATVAGSGPATLVLTYVSGNARWFPVYDLTLVPDRAQVQVAFAALVSQESGEDWNGAKLTVSTAVPANATVFPKFRTWKIGEKERFIPTPSPAPEYLPPAPRSVPPLAHSDVEEDQLRRRLYAQLGQVAGGRARGGDEGYYRAASGELSKQNGRVDEDMDGVADDRIAADKPMPPPKMAPPAPPPQPSVAAAPAPIQMKEEMERNEVTTPDAAPGAVASGMSFASNPTPAAFQVGLSPPPGYVAPSYASNLPAALAGGYDLSFNSVQPESVPSGGGAKRVALFAASWPVSVERKLFPALAPEAFLVAELKNPQPTALPGGEANLYVGNDPAGTAHLGFVAPGEPFTLPLGLDRAVKPVRNVKLVLAEKGIIGKDEVSEYDVTLELLNPYSVPIAVKLFDQWPVTDDEHVQVKLLTTAPYAKQDTQKGSLEWDLTVAPHAKTQVSFSYSIRRPKDYRLHQ